MTLATLSKSDFKLASTCVTKLYYKEQNYPQRTDENPYLELLAEGGYMVEQLARLLYPAGVEMEYGDDPVLNAAATAEMLRRDSVTLFEATLLIDRKLARVDILQKHGNRFDLIEVKSKSFEGEDLAEGVVGPFRGKPKPHAVLADWRPYLEDVAYQTYLLQSLYPDAEVVPHLLVVDKSKMTSTEGLPAMFDIQRDVLVNGRRKDLDVRFVGDVAAVRPAEFLRAIDVRSEVADLLLAVIEAATYFASLYSDNGPIRVQREIDWSCRGCEFHVEAPQEPNGYRECWGRLAEPSPHIFDLYKLGSNRWSGKRLGDVLIRNGRTGLFDVDPAHLVKANGEPTKDSVRQIVQIDHTRRGAPWIGDSLASAVSALRWPLHFIDFETSTLAVPYHAGMRPYEMVGFQWSCHTVGAPGARPEHSEWLNDRDSWPCLEFAETLRRTVGDDGTVLMWATHEKTTLRKIREQMDRYRVGDAPLREWMDRMVGANDRPQRLVDMNELCVKGFFFPGMGGRTSIKVVLDALWQSDGVMRERYAEWVDDAALIMVPGIGPYAGLPSIAVDGVALDVADGTGAMRAYQAMLYGAERHDERTRAAWATLLRRYCKLDTLAMVLIWDHWRRAVA